MNKELIDKSVAYNNDFVIITEQTRVRLNKEQLEIQLSEIQRQKYRLKEQNIRTISEYSRLQDEELEIKALINNLQNETEEDLEEI